jgi:hypothetical protein
MAVQNELKVTASRQPRRRPRFSSKLRPRAKFIPPVASTPISIHQDTPNSTERKACIPTKDVDEIAEPKQTRFSLHLTICNTVLATVGFVSALCFGVITIMQADTANKEAKVANKIAWKSLLLSWVQTCAQVVDVSVSRLDFEVVRSRSND